MKKENCYRVSIVAFSLCPGPRYCMQGDNSGEEFYHTILNESFYKAYESKQDLLLDLDGTYGFAASFLDEIYGNLIYDFGADIIEKKVFIKSDEEPEWKEMLLGSTMLRWKDRINEKSAPHITRKHAAWYRFVNGKMEKKIWVQL